MRVLVTMLVGVVVTGMVVSIIMDFEKVTRDKFYLCIESNDEQYDAANTRKFMEELHPNNVWEVPY